MMKILVLLLLVTPKLWAGCPNEVVVNNQELCLEVEWGTGQKKVKGQFVDVEEISPYLVPMGEIPQKWIYSQALIRLWMKGDVSQAPVFPQGFRVFPYMIMGNHHHHGTSYDLAIEAEGYRLSQVAFTAMNGNWQLRWTVHESDELSSSQLLLELFEYTNFDRFEVEMLKSLCAS